MGLDDRPETCMMVGYLGWFLGNAVLMCNYRDCCVMITSDLFDI